MPQLIATWNDARDAWEIPDTEGLLCEHLAVWSATFPRSAMWDASGLYELPTSEPRTDGSGSSLLPILPTPTSKDREGDAPSRTGAPSLSGPFMASISCRRPTHTPVADPSTPASGPRAAML